MILAFASALAAAVAGWIVLPEAERRSKLDALAKGLQALPLAERAALAAKLLEISHRALLYKIKEYGIS